MKLHLSFYSFVLVSFVVPALAEDQTQLAQASGKGAEQLMRQEATQPAVASADPQLAEVEKMSRAGVKESTLLTYVATSPGFSLSAEDVLALHKRGVSLTVITAMLRHPSSAEPNMAPATPVPVVPAIAPTIGPNQPIIYPTPAREAVPLTDPVVVSYTGQIAYDSPAVLIVSSPYSAAAVSGRNFGFSGSYGYYGQGYSSYGYGAPCYGSSRYGCYSGRYSYGGSRCRY